jgi:hypothetical protein
MINAVNFADCSAIYFLLSSRLLSKNVKVKISKTIILPVHLYGFETWSLTLREGHKLWVFENRVQRRVSGPKRDEVSRGWRKLQNGELCDLYSSTSIIRIIKSRRMRSGACSRNGGEEERL